jgi:hypothetical protein
LATRLVKNSGNNYQRTSFVPRLVIETHKIINSSEKSNRKANRPKIVLKKNQQLLFFHPDKRIVGWGYVQWVLHEYNHFDDRLDAKFVRSDPEQDIASFGKVRVVGRRIV